MSINGVLYTHPEVRPAIDDAVEILDNWLDGLGELERATVISVCSGWERVALVEAVATALLARSGITADDIDSFEDIWEVHGLTGVSDGAMLEQWDAERKAPR